ncbi:MAG TPA: DNA polymerase [Candidatus Paceibacterota bacterium]|nr:DNA polymerase [Candidatus Paceibacterota bacterium]
MAKKNKKRIVLLDSHAILHRAYHALPDFSSSGGEPTGALYGLSSMLISIIKELKPDHIVAAFDLPKPTYRHEAYTDYKAGRKESDVELVSQIKRSYDLYKAFNIPIYEKEGYEADDVLGTLAEQLKDRADIIIASGDMDTLQLVDDDRVRVFTLKKGIKDTITYNEKMVRERFGFGPELLPDYKGLRGDPSDNIIGVSGIGEKTATILISQIGSIENIFKTLKKNPEKFAEIGIKERIVNLLKENQEEAEFSKMLATIRRDVPIKFEIPKKEWYETVSQESIQKIFRELDFRTLAIRVKEILPQIAPDQNKIDFSGNTGNGNVGNAGINIQDSANIVDQKILSEAKIALWLINSAITDPDLEDILNYTGEKNLELAYKKILQQIEKDGLKKIFDEIEKPLIPIIDNMEKNGVKIDTIFLKKLSEEYHVELSKLEKKIWQMAGEEFNINSPQQMSEILFNKMQLKYKGMRKTSTGKLSTREDVLQKMKGEHKIIDEILNYREFQKLLSTYIDAIPKSVASDGRLHANFLQSGTTTGRMSSNNPNLQNIPIGTERGRKIRNAFVVEKGNVLVAFDYSQIELRIAAILSGDKKLIKVFKDGEDIHTNVASEIFKISKEKVTKEMRRQAKIINFGILYGMGVNALKEGIGSDRETAQKFYNEYFSIYTGLAEYLEKTKKDAQKNGYTRTLFGRRRYFDGFNSPLPYIRAQAERMAINAPIQGTQADLIKTSMLKIDKYLKDQKATNEAKLILQIHDEVIYEMKKDVVDKHVEQIRKIMESVLTKEEAVGVPIISDCSVGENWEVMKKISKKI